MTCVHNYSIIQHIFTTLKILCALTPQPLAFPTFYHLHQFSSVTQSCLTFCDLMDCSTPGFPVHHQLLELAQTHVHDAIIGDAIQPSHPLLSPFPPTFNLSEHQGLFKWVSSLHQVAKILEFQLQHQSFQWIFRTDFLRIDWFDLLAAQGTLKSFLQHHSSKASILQCSTLFIVQLSHPYMTTGKTIALTRQTFVGKVMSLLFNILSSLVIAFLPRSQGLLRSRHGRNAISSSCLRAEYQHILFGSLCKRCVPSTPYIYPNKNA